MYLTWAYTANNLPIPSRVQPKASRDPKAATALPTSSSSGAEPETSKDSKAITKAKRATALFSYESEWPGELRMVEGDTITEIGILNKHWWAGRNRGVRGLFPRNHVELIEDDDQAPSETLGVEMPDAVVLWNRKPSTVAELQLTERDLITNIIWIDENTWMGKNPRGASGYFPSRSVELISTDPDAPPVNCKRVVALWDFKQREDNELPFKIGDQITVLGVPDPEWWVGKSSKGAVGLIPSNHVRVEQIPGINAASEGSDGD